MTRIEPERASGDDSDPIEPQEHQGDDADKRPVRGRSSEVRDELGIDVLLGDLCYELFPPPIDVVGMNVLRTDRIGVRFGSLRFGTTNRCSWRRMRFRGDHTLARTRYMATLHMAGRYAKERRRSRPDGTHRRYIRDRGRFRRATGFDECRFQPSICRGGSDVVAGPAADNEQIDVSRTYYSTEPVIEDRLR